MLLEVRKNEVKKLVPLAALIFCILFNYGMVHALKDGLVVSKLGAEAASFIDLWVVLPAVFIFTLIYLKISLLVTDKQKLFTLFGILFLGFFIGFAFLLYPNLDNITFSKERIIMLIEDFPRLKWFIIIAGKWPIALFNIFSELWVGVMLALLFWQYVNSMTPSEQAKRFYPLLGLIGNIAFIGSSIVLKQFLLDNTVGQALQYSAMLMALIGMIGLLMFSYSWKAIKPFNVHTQMQKFKLSFKESIKLVFTSKYLWLLNIMVIAYGISMVISQGLWKAQVLKLYTSTDEYILFMADYQKWTGITSIMATIVAGVALRKYSWFFCAIVTPLMMLIIGGLFFSITAFENSLLEQMPVHEYLIFCVLAGTLCVVCAKAAKISWFDTTKELAYIPLEANLRDKGKAAVDLLGERLGKALGALLQSILFIMAPNSSYTQWAFLFLLIFIIVVAFWLLAVYLLDKEYLTLTHKTDSELKMAGAY